MLNEARDIFIEKLKQNEYKIKDMENYEGFAYFIITDRGTFCITFKGDWYHGYGMHFNEDNDWGQVASTDILQECLKRGALFSFVLPSLNIYCIDPKVFIGKGRAVKHLENHLAVNWKEFKNFNQFLEEEYLEWC